MALGGGEIVQPTRRRQEQHSFSEVEKTAINTTNQLSPTTAIDVTTDLLSPTSTVITNQLSPTTVMVSINAADPLSPKTPATPSINGHTDHHARRREEVMMRPLWLPPTTSTPWSTNPRDHHDRDVVEVREVWSSNLGEELRNIDRALGIYTGVCIDTEFPGTVVDITTPHYLRSPAETYAVVKSNVDRMKLLQLGLTLFSPEAGERCPVVWQFNFRGFDEKRDLHAPTSIALLKDHGMDFPKLQEHGIDPRLFAHDFSRSALAASDLLTWAAFSGSYDFAYLLKLIRAGEPLPETLEEFMAQIHAMIGPWLLDVKYIARFCGNGGIRGGLKNVAAALGVQRCVGRPHNAGSDSLLAADVLLAMVDRFLRYGAQYAHAGKIDNLALAILL